jgi:hypothetical protein
MGFSSEAVQEEERPEKSQMTLESFFEELFRIRDRFEWRLEPDAPENAERREWTRFQIRAASPDPAIVELFDPLGAVCFGLTGQVCSPGNWAEAARVIGLPEGEARRVTSAANDLTWVEAAGGHRRPNTDLQAIRVELIRTVETSARVIHL